MQKKCPLKRCLFFIIVLMISAFQGSSQLFNNGGNTRGDMSSMPSNPSDSSRNKIIKTNDSIVIYAFTYQDSTRCTIDSSIHLFHRSPLIGAWESDLGNIGSSSNTVFFNPSLSPANQLGIRSNSAYVYSIDKVYCFEN